ncbi:unnamed protein product [Cladocopium goreaui]|uniref:Uncharacterized protein n=1 Tax=Cladocopium goreaui TaxID=2562237 RepID=A0A9P1M4Q2_9DINO|nr:unnamed protein product [Cladocopium goreaui]|mmetsp:Transcript_2425/g.5662  ORF Transcript_2425/g.5662 Transcript_2425/m.5662 type:complete len:146 (+) Transcript_2425:86-523(+)
MLRFIAVVTPWVLTFGARPMMSHEKLPGKLSICTCPQMPWKEQLKTPCCQPGLVCEPEGDKGHCRNALGDPCKKTIGGTMCASKIYLEDRKTTCKKNWEGKGNYCCLKSGSKPLLKDDNVHYDSEKCCSKKVKGDPDDSSTHTCD